MNGLQLGTIVLSGERLGIIAGVFVFMIGAGLLATRVNERFNLWSTVVVFGGLAAARIGHVLTHWEYFAEAPLRVFAVWQSGFQWIWVAPVVVLASILLLKTKRERGWALVPVAVSALVWTLAYQLTSATEPLPAPHMTLDQLDGPPVTLSQADDRPTVINLWATWCPPCRREMPALAQAEERNPDVRFLFINQGEGGDKIRDYLEMEGINLRHILLDPAMDVPEHYRTVGLPVTLFLNTDGTLGHAHIGEIAPEQIAHQIARLN